MMTIAQMTLTMSHAMKHFYNLLYHGYANSVMLN
jgi:hypothetical protein